MVPPDRTRYLLAGALLLVVGSWLVADVVRGEWWRVVFRSVLAVVLVAVILTLARLRGR